MDGKIYPIAFQKKGICCQIANFLIKNLWGESMNKHEDRLTLYLESGWTVWEFTSLFTAVNKMYLLLLVLATEDAAALKKFLRVPYSKQNLILPAFYVSPQLRIEKIHIASPGEVNLLGFHKIIKELRELLKDLIYRNKQERINGELDIDLKKVRLIQEKLKVIDELDLPLEKKLALKKRLLMSASELQGTTYRVEIRYDLGERNAKNIDKIS